MEQKIAYTSQNVLPIQVIQFAAKSDLNWASKDRIKGSIPAVRIILVHQKNINLKRAPLSKTQNQPRGMILNILECGSHVTGGYHRRKVE